MQLTVLVDNNTYIDRYFEGEPGLSFFIETDGKKILFDLGYSNLFLRNAHRLNLDLLQTDTVILSHGHNDHTLGIVELLKRYGEAKAEKLPFVKPELIAHPAAFYPKYDRDGIETGLLISADKLERYFQLRLTKEPLWLSEKLVFLGQIARRTTFEACEPYGKMIINGQLQDDYLLDDSALVYRAEGGLVIITGCSHSGICNIIEQAKQVCGEERIIDIIGGFHLQKPGPAKLAGTLQYLAELKPNAVHTCHCTDLASKIALAQVVNMPEVGVGLKLKYN